MQRADKRKYHVIYKTTCLVNNKFYIGMHSTDNLEDGYLGSGKRLLYSVHKHGKENHRYEILEYLSSRPELKAREAEIVNEELLGENLCMNIALGGSGGFEHLTDEHRKIASRRAADAIKNRRKTDAIFDANMRDRLSMRFKKFHQEGKITANRDGNVFRGHIHTEETKAKMSLKARERVGDKNSQYGTCWIFNDDCSLNKKIDKFDLDKWTSNGWTKGRKYFNDVSTVIE